MKERQGKEKERNEKTIISLVNFLFQSCGHQSIKSTLPQHLPKRCRSGTITNVFPIKQPPIMIPRLAHSKTATGAKFLPHVARNTRAVSWRGLFL